MPTSHRLTGHERLYGSSAIQGDAMILDFWRWAFSDLRMHSVQSVFAEWMVARLLGIRLRVRDAWSEYDLVASNGVRLEVKAAAYVQAREQDGPLSRIVFRYAPSAARSTDLYVFCVQIEKDPERWDALDLAQWRFYTVTGAEVRQLGQTTIALNVLRELCVGMRAKTFQVKAARLIRALGKSYNASVG